MQLSQLTKTLSDETRLRILMLLTKSEELCVCQFTQILDLSQPKVSRHLGVLREVGLLQDRKSGLWVYYRLHKDLPDWVLTTLSTLQVAATNQEPYKNDTVLLKKASTEVSANCGS